MNTGETRKAGGRSGVRGRGARSMGKRAGQKRRAGEGRTDGEKMQGGILLRAACRGAGIGLACGVLLLLLLCAVCMNTKDPSHWVQLFSYAALFPAPIICGCTAAHRAASRGLLAGLAGGALFCCLLWALSLCLPEHAGSVGGTGAGLSPGLSLAAAGGCILLSALAGFCVTHRKPKPPRMKRR